MIDGPLLERLYRKADAARWAVPLELFRETLEAGLMRAFSEGSPRRRELRRHLESLHLEDLALACACAAGDERAWEHFMAVHRSVLYRAADALDPSGAAREVADSLYAELYGVRGDRDSRESLFRYFHGRSSLSTWLRAVLAQRYIDEVRRNKRTTSIDEGEWASIPGPGEEPNLRFATLVGDTLRSAIAALSVKDRLRLRAYYEQDLTLAQVGRITGEHEATVSRRMSKTRQTLRKHVEQRLREDGRLTESEVERCLASVINDAGPLDLAALFAEKADRKNRVFERSE
jgi:RNA polymerase sigma-70 factor (ECF subfamily)